MQLNSLPLSPSCSASPAARPLRQIGRPDEGLMLDWPRLAFSISGLSPVHTDGESSLSNMTLG